MSGEVPASLDEFVQQLPDWLRQSYLEASSTPPVAVESDIHETWHRRHDMI
jgi:hypothetical protein